MTIKEFTASVGSFLAKHFGRRALCGVRSDASNLVPGDTNGTYDVFVRDLQTGAITRVSTGDPAQIIRYR